MQSVPITTKVVSLNPAHGEVFSMQLCDNVVSDIATVGVFLRVQIFFHTGTKVRVCCLRSISVISWQEQVTFRRDDDNVHFALKQHA